MWRQFLFIFATYRGGEGVDWTTAKVSVNCDHFQRKSAKVEDNLGCSVGFVHPVEGQQVDLGGLPQGVAAWGKEFQCCEVDETELTACIILDVQVCQVNHHVLYHGDWLVGSHLGDSGGRGLVIVLRSCTVQRHPVMETTPFTNFSSSIRKCGCTSPTGRMRNPTCRIWIGFAEELNNLWGR